MLMRFDPFRETDRWADQALAALAGLPGRVGSMPLDAYRHGDELTIYVDLPGVDPGSIELTVEKNVLTVAAERRGLEEEDSEVLVNERPTGKFTRQLFLGEGLDTSKVEASYDKGVLRVLIPVAEQAKPRKVQIATGGSNGSTPIEAGSRETAPTGS
ncbi:MAG: Hsp20/alpha crystallin family protein [Actinobacteria bacterium]|nr:Hsp20/alpha crystallin family protein [Actinomycetota bacterium]